MQVHEVSFVSAGWLGIILIALCVAGLALLVLILMNRSGPSGPILTHAAPALPTLTAEESRRRRTEILEQLAAKQLNKEEAEAQLLALGDPVPALATPPPVPRRPGGRGCLIALFILLVVGPLLLVGFVVIRPSRVMEEMHEERHFRQQNGELHRVIEDTLEEK